MQPFAVGSGADYVSRLRRAMPRSWFPSTGATDAVSATPVLDAVLAGLASAWAWCYDNLQYVAAQTRLRTASDVWLDVAALDFYGVTLQRRASEGDEQFRRRVIGNLFRARGTRPAMVRAVRDLVGTAPIVFEPVNTSDTGGYGSQSMRAGSGLGYGAAGGYGSLLLPFQAFLQVVRPAGQGIPNAPGYGNSGGYSVGGIEYSNLSRVMAQTTDADVYAEIALTTPVAVVSWVALTGKPVGGGTPLGQFILGVNTLGVS